MMNRVLRHGGLVWPFDRNRFSGVRIRFVKGCSRACHRDSNAMTMVKNLAHPSDLKGDLVNLAGMHKGFLKISLRNGAAHRNIRELIGMELLKTQTCSGVNTMLARSTVLSLSLMVVTSVCPAADWPTYLGNNERTATTDELLKLPLKLSWKFASPSAPNKAWSGAKGRTIEGRVLSDRVKFDDALQVAIVGGRVYFGSSIDHQVRCVDAKTGEQLWTFFTDAPVRLAPTVADGHVFVGSDDGYAYCLEAGTGKLVWKMRLGPADEQIIARGEMISRWPIRTSVLVDDGVAYFGAGIFPHENVYMCAVKADTGEVIWRNDNISHQDAGRNDLTPQGYLLATDEVIFVPNGRSRPKAVSRATGKLSGGSTTSLKFKETIIAGTDALVADNRLNLYSLGTRLAVSGDTSYAANGKEVIRMNRKKFAAANSRRAKISSELRTLTRSLRGAGDKVEEIKAKITKLQEEAKSIANEGIDWQVACSAEASLVVTPNLVIAGADGKIIAFDSETGEEKWSTEVDGTARGIAVADGNLVVSTTSGKVYRFGTEETRSAGEAKLVEDPFPKDELTATYEQAAQDILKHSGITRGYCLVIGNDQGRLAFELAKRSDLKIYAVEPDDEKVQRSRQLLSSAGLYGNRITVHHVQESTIPYSNYFANLIVSDVYINTGNVPIKPKDWVRHLKPAGGVICIGGRGVDPFGYVYKELDKHLPNNDLKVVDGWVKLNRGTLPGAGNWSHQYAEAGNTANSGDKLVKGGLGVLWYGDPGPGMMVNRHQGAVGPLVVNGRMFVQGEDNLMAYDAYNGMFLWQVKNAEAIRTGVFQNRSPGNLAADDVCLYHMAREKLYQHDAATGEVQRTYELPEGVDREKHEWGYLAVDNGLLIGTATMRGEVAELNRRRRGNPGDAATDSIFAFDTKTGKHLWTYQGKSINFQTIALGPDRVYFVDSSVTSEQRAAILREDKSELKELKGEERKRAEERMKKLDVRLAVAVNAKTGEEIWSKPIDVTDCSNIGIGGGKLTLMYNEGTLIFCGANANGHYWNQFVSGEFSRRRLVALNSLDGYKLWSKDANYRHRPIIIGDQVIAEPWAFELRSGKQITRTHPITGKEEPFSIMRPGHHCGMLTGCDNLVLFRSGYTGFVDLKSDSGTRHFAGHRLGCWINAIPTNGLVVIPEASAGCVCMFSIASTIVMEPREARRPWTLYSGVGATTPVKQMTLNFGAPGDRRDAHGKLWLAYPRPTPNSRLETSLDIKMNLNVKFASGGAFFSRDGDEAEQSESELAWVASSGGRGLIHFELPLLGDGDKPANYNLRLLMSVDSEKSLPLAIKLQGETIDAGSITTIVDKANPKLVIREINNLVVQDKLTADIGESSGVLNGIEVTRNE